MTAIVFAFEIDYGLRANVARKSKQPRAVNHPKRSLLGNEWLGERLESMAVAAFLGLVDDVVGS